MNITVNLFSCSGSFGTRYSYNDVHICFNKYEEKQLGSETCERIRAEIADKLYPIQHKYNLSTTK